MSPTEQITSTSRPRRIKSAAFLALLLIGSAIGNWASVSVLFGVDFIFGSFFTLLVLVRFGLAAGLVSAAIAGFVTVLSWGHPWAALVMLGEAGIVGLLFHRRKINLLGSVALYWLIVGMPGLWLALVATSMFPPESALLVSLKHCSNGLFNALAASMVLLTGVRWSYGAGTTPRVSSQELLFVLVSGLVFIPSLIFTVIQGQRSVLTLEEDVFERFERNANGARFHIGVWYDKRIGALSDLVAEQISPEQLRIRTGIIQSSLPGLVAVAVMDADGQILASSASPTFPAEDDWINAAAMEAEARPSPGQPQPFPLLQHPELLGLTIAGEVGGGRRVVAAIDQSHLDDLVQEISYGRSIAARLQTASGLTLSASSFPELDGLARRRAISSRESGLFLLSPTSQTLPSVLRWNQSHYGEEVYLEAGPGLRLLMTTPVAPLQDRLHVRYRQAFGLSLIFAYLGFLFAWFISRSLSRPLLALSTITSRLPDDPNTATEGTEWPSSAVEEVARLVENFRTMKEELQATFGRLEAKSRALEEEIEERRRIETALREREQEISSVVTNAPDVIARFDRQNRHLFINPAIERITSLPPEVFLGKTSRELGMPTDICEFWERKLKEVWETGKAVELNYLFPSPQGSLYFESRVEPERDVSGRIISVLGVTRDVTVKKRAELLVAGQNGVLELLATGATLPEILESALSLAGQQIPGAVLTYEWSWLGANRLPVEIQSAHPLPREGVQWIEIETEGTRPEEHLPDGGLVAWRTAIRAATGEIFGFLTCLSPIGGLPPADARKCLLAAARLAGIAIERHLAAESLRKAEAALRSYASELEKRVADRTAKLQESHRSLESFCYSIAHDLRAPLRAIQGFSSALTDEYGAEIDEGGKVYLSRIQRAAERMDTLIRDLLAYGRVSHSEVPTEVVSLKQSIHDALYLVSTDLEQAGATVEVAQEDFPCVFGNAVFIEQALVNLISNAIKYVAPGVAPRLRIQAETGEKTVRVLVEDNGIGIKPEHHQRIFRVFERLHGASAYSGTGVGLAIVATAMERMGGTVGVDSEEGQGSTFWFELRRAERPAEEMATTGSLFAGGQG